MRRDCVGDNSASGPNWICRRRVFFGVVDHGVEKHSPNDECFFVFLYVFSILMANERYEDVSRYIKPSAGVCGTACKTEGPAICPPARVSARRALCLQFWTDWTNNSQLNLGAIP